MRKSHVTVLVLASIVTMASQASAQSAPARGGARAGSGIGRGGDRGPDGKGLFQGITLSTAEKSKLKDVTQTYHSQTEALRSTLAPALKEARVARQKGDTAAARAVFERTKADREKLHELMKQEKSDIRSALSAENQQKFDKNLTQVAQRRERGRKGGEVRGQGRAGPKMLGRGRRGSNG